VAHTPRGIRLAQLAGWEQPTGNNQASTEGRFTGVFGPSWRIDPRLDRTVLKPSSPSATIQHGRPQAEKRDVCFLISDRSVGTVTPPSVQILATWGVALLIWRCAWIEERWGCHISDAE
jgi:hypothetical protein